MVTVPVNSGNNFRAADYPETLSRPSENGVVLHPIRREMARVVHQLGPQPPKTILRLLFLRRHFRLKTAAALQWPTSELFHLTTKLKCLSTCAKLFHCCNCSDALNTANCNRAIHFETRCI
jgi:hypothetical protein